MKDSLESSDPPMGRTEGCISSMPASSVSHELVVFDVLEGKPSR